jgi:hypothetical protein
LTKRKTTMIYAIFFIATLLLPSVGGFATGAQGCGANGPAVGGAHLGLDDNRLVSVKPWSSADTLKIDGALMVKGANTLATRPKLLRADVAQFKGILIRLSYKADPNSTAYEYSIIPNTAGIATAKVCVAPVVGITHTSNNIKQVAEGKLNITSPGVYTVDITVVFNNNQTTSEYTHQGYEIDVQCPTICKPGSFFANIFCRFNKKHPNRICA